MTTAFPRSPDELRHAVELLVQTQEVTPVLIALFDRNDQLLWANSAFRNNFGLQPKDYPTWCELMLHSQSLGLGTSIQTEDLQQWITSVRTRRGKTPYRAMECDMQDGRWIWMTETVCPDGSMLCIGCDITHLRHDERMLRQQRDLALRAAMTDALTGLSNRAHILSLLQEQIQHLTQGGHSCGLVLLDLDHFKQVNDRYGHQAGDTVLCHFARLLPQVLRREDCYGRVGGEEFVLLLPNVAASSMASAVQRLIAMLPLYRPLEDAPDFFYTCSAGMTLLQLGDTTTSALRRVDEALYAAKRLGRNCLVCADTSNRV